MLDLKELITIGAQIPIVIIAFYFIGRQIEVLAKRVEEQNVALQNLIHETNTVIRGVTEAMTAVRVMIERSPGLCPIEMKDEKETKQR